MHVDVHGQEHVVMAATPARYSEATATYRTSAGSCGRGWVQVWCARGSRAGDTRQMLRQKPRTYFFFFFAWSKNILLVSPYLYYDFVYTNRKSVLRRSESVLWRWTQGVNSYFIIIKERYVFYFIFIDANFFWGVRICFYDKKLFHFSFSELTVLT